MKTNGFTLIEMLTVVLIIGILTSVVLPQYRRAIQKSQATEAIAMLRVIHDSGERLAAEFGYRNFQAFSANTGVPAQATFQRLDMFDNSTIKCAFTADTMTCDNFVYYLNKGQNYITAKKLKTPYKDTQIRLYREDLPRLTCVGEQSACDLYNLDWESN